jgi:putative transposase
MPHTYAQNLLHVVFSTKDRAKFIPKDFQPQLWAYTAGVCNRHGIHPRAIGGVQDHLHLLVQLPPTLALSEAVRIIKANSSRWAREQGQQFAWQEGYAAFSVSSSITPAVLRYIQNQETHHKKISFTQEFLAILKKHHVDFDPNFVFG